MKLSHLIYSSIAVSTVGPAELKTLLLQTRAANAEREVTGILLYSEGNFFQVLEGADEVISPLYSKISLDSRHRRVTKIIQEPIQRRAFDKWSMAYAEINSSDLVSIDCVDELSVQHSMLLNLPPGRARKLLEAFSAGRWRARLTESSVQ